VDRRERLSNSRNYISIESKKGLWLGLPAVLIMYLTMFTITPVIEWYDNIQITAEQKQNDAQIAESLAARIKKVGASTSGHASILFVMNKIAQSTDMKKYVSKISPFQKETEDSLRVEVRSAPHKNVVLFLEGLARAHINVKQIKVHQAKESGFVDVTLIMFKKA